MVNVEDVTLNKAKDKYCMVLFLCEIIIIANFIETENRMMVARS